MRKIRKQRSRIGFTDSHFLQLACGYDFFHSAWGDLHYTTNEQQQQTLQQMRAAWEQPGVQQQVEAIFRQSNEAWQRCWAWWEFTSPQPRDFDMEEHLQLHQMGLLPAAEAKAITKEAHQAYMASHYFHGPFKLFRRLPSWWALLAPERRNNRQSELQQLVRLQQLTEPERELLHADEQQRQGWLKQPHLLKHLHTSEQQLLGLPQHFSKRS